MAPEVLTEVDQTMQLRVEYRYTYERPIRDLRHRIVAVPRAQHGRQRRRTWSMRVGGVSAKRQTSLDAFGNHIVTLSVLEVPSEITFAISSTIAWSVHTGGGNPIGPRTQCLMKPTALTQSDDEVGEIASHFRASSKTIAEFAEQVCEWSSHSIDYEYGVTNVRTSAVAALKCGRGVCQDYAHIMLALCRAVGVPASYVSGHLVGEGGSHAWVEVLTETGWLAFDPTNARRTDHRYLTVAVGKEYTDVAPTSGVFSVGGPGVLISKKHLSVLPTPN